MAITPEQLTRPNRQNNDPANPNALIIPEFTGIVEQTIARKSVVEPWVPVRTVKGTNTVTNYAVGAPTLGKVSPGEAPPATPGKFSKNSLIVDTMIYARNALFFLETFQTAFDARQQIAQEHGKHIAKYKDQAFLIQAAKAAQLTASTFGPLDGHSGGSTYTLGAAADRTDPSKLYYALGKIAEALENKDVDPLADDVVIFLRPQEYYTLLNSEQLINSELITAAGNTVKTRVLSALGIPVISTNNLPTGTVTGHLLGASYDGDFSKVVAVAFSPRALLAGETIPVSSNLWFDNSSFTNYIDSYLSFGVTPNRPEYAAAILTP